MSDVEVEPWIPAAIAAVVASVAKQPGWWLWDERHLDAAISAARYQVAPIVACDESERIIEAAGERLQELKVARQI